VGTGKQKLETRKKSVPERQRDERPERGRGLNG